MCAQKSGLEESDQAEVEGILHFNMKEDTVGEGSGSLKRNCIDSIRDSVPVTDDCTSHIERSSLIIEAENPMGNSLNGVFALDLTILISAENEIAIRFHKTLWRQI